MPHRRLTSWKEIAAHLGVSVRTAQRWEATERLPVERHRHSSQSSVYAQADELTRWWESRAPGRPSPSIAVLPFVNFDRDEDTEVLSDGLTEDLITALSQLRQLRVVARSSTFRFKGAPRDLREVASSLGVGHVLEGSLRRSGSRLRVTAQLIRAEDGCHLWSERFDRDMEDPLDVQERLAGAIAGSLRIRLLGQRPESRRTRDVDTYNAFLRGRFFWNQRAPASLRRAIACFEEAIAKDQLFAAAHAGLADCYVFLWAHGGCRQQDVLPRAEAAAGRAIELDPALGEAHASLGLCRIGQRDIRGAEAAFRRALELNPGDARSRHWRAMTLAAMNRYDEALIDVERALDLDPFGATVNQDAGRILYGAGRYREAIARLRQCLEIAPQAPWTSAYLTLASLLVGDDQSALAAAADDVFRAFVRAWMGEGDDARTLLGAERDPPLSLARRGLLHLGLGQPEHAITLLRRGVEQFEPDAFELHRGLRPFVRDPGLRADLDALLQTPPRGLPGPVARENPSGTRPPHPPVSRTASGRSRTGGRPASRRG